MKPIERVDEIHGATDFDETMCAGNIASLSTENFNELCDIATKALEENERLRKALKPMVRELNKCRRRYNEHELNFDEIRENGQFGVHFIKAELEAAVKEE